MSKKTMLYLGLGGLAYYFFVYKPSQQPAPIMIAPSGSTPLQVAQNATALAQQLAANPLAIVGMN